VLVSVSDATMVADVDAIENRASDSSSNAGRDNQSMPFTFAHAAAALPFRRTRLIPSALVVGCFAPDLPYFVRLSPGGGFGHTIPGLFVLDLPLGLAVLWLFHRYAKEPLWNWLPEGFRQRVRLGPRTLDLRASRLALVLVSIFVGSVTHILWDSFTHHSFWPYHHWQFLRYSVPLPIMGSLQLFDLLQYASSVIGMIVIFVWFLRRVRIDVPTYTRTIWSSRANDRTLLAAFVAAALVAGYLRGMVGVENAPWEHFKNFIEYLVVTSIGVFSFEVLVYGLILDRWGRNQATA
jgi:hypothetical protein